MKRITLVAIAAAAMLAFVLVSCQKTEMPTYASPLHPMSYAGGTNWNLLYSFGTYDSVSGCSSSAALCHLHVLTPCAPENLNLADNEALAEICAVGENGVMISVDLNGVNESYLDELANTGEITVSHIVEWERVSADTGLPGAEDSCNVRLPLILDFVIPAGTYPLIIEAAGGDARLEIEGLYEAGEWSWTFYMR